MEIILLTKPDFEYAEFVYNMLLNNTEHSVSIHTGNPDNIDGDYYDLAISYFYPYILRPHHLEKFKYAINVHIGLLPWGRGADPHVWAIVDNEPAGVTIHMIDEGIDTGPVIVRNQVSFGDTVTGDELYRLLCLKSVGMVAEVLFVINQRSKYGLDLFPHSSLLLDNSICIGSYHTKNDFRELCNLSESLRSKSPEEIIRILRALSFVGYNNGYIEKNGEKIYYRISCNTQD